MIKEYLLIPRSRAESLLSSNNDNDKRSITSTSPPPPARKKKVKVGKPSLRHLLHLYTPPSIRDYTESLLTMFENAPGVEWDTSGNLISPVRGENILEIISVLGMPKSSSYRNHRIDIPGLKLLLDTANIPPKFLKNASLKAKLNKGGGRMTLGSSWVTYR